MPTPVEKPGAPGVAGSVIRDAGVVGNVTCAGVLFTPAAGSAIVCGSNFNCGRPGVKNCRVAAKGRKRGTGVEAGSTTAARENGGKRA